MTKTKALNIYNRILKAIPGTYLRESNGGVWHVVIKQNEKTIASVQHRGKSKERPFKLFYPYGKWGVEQKKEYFSGADKLALWVKNNSNKLLNEA